MCPGLSSAFEEGRRTPRVSVEMSVVGKDRLGGTVPLRLSVLPGQGGVGTCGAWALGHLGT